MSVLGIFMAAGSLRITDMHLERTEMAPPSL